MNQKILIDLLYRSLALRDDAALMTLRDALESAARDSDSLMLKFKDGAWIPLKTESH